MKKSNFALRLQPSLMEEAKKVAKAEGRSGQSADQRGSGGEGGGPADGGILRRAVQAGDVHKALRILKRAGAGKPPVEVAASVIEGTTAESTCHRRARPGQDDSGVRGGQNAWPAGLHLPVHDGHASRGPHRHAGRE